MPKSVDSTKDVAPYDGTCPDCGEELRGEERPLSELLADREDLEVGRDYGEDWTYVSLVCDNCEYIH